MSPLCPQYGLVFARLFLYKWPLPSLFTPFREALVDVAALLQLLPQHAGRLLPLGPRQVDQVQPRPPVSVQRRKWKRNWRHLHHQIMGRILEHICVFK